MKQTQRIALFFVALFALLVSMPARTETVSGGFRFTYTGPSEFIYPYDGKKQSIRFSVTNTAATASTVYALRVSVNGSANEYPGYAHFPNGAKFSLAAGESSVVSSWAQGVYENLGPTTPPAVGESKEYTFDFVFTDASKPIAEITAADTFTVSQKVMFTNLGDTPTLTGGLALGGTVRFSGATTLPNNALVEVATPYSPRWYVATATAANTTADGAGLTVTQSLPLRSDWLVRISASGYASKVVALADITTGTTATLGLTLEKRAAPTLSYKLAQQIATPTGFWRGAVSESEGTFVAIPGQENWKTGATDAETRSYREASKLYKFKFDGTKVWEHAPGWEIWGGDMTPDGKYVAYALNPSYTSFYQPTEYKLVLLDGMTGTQLWAKTGPTSTSDITFSSEARKLESLEVALSPDGNYVAVGSVGSGQVTVFDRTTGTELWATSNAPGANFGQVRNLKFSSDSQFLYAGSGDNFLRKFRVSDGTAIWKAMVGGWPFVNGLNFSPDGTLVTTGTKSFDTAVVRASDGVVLWFRNTQYFDSVPSPDGAVTTSFNGVIYRLSDGVIAGMTKTHALSAYTPDGAYLLRMDSDLALYDLTGVKLLTFDKSGLNTNAGEQPQWSYATKDGRYVIGLGRDMSTPGSTGVAIWERTSDTTSTAPVCTLSASPTAITAGNTSTLTASCAPAATGYTWTGGTCTGTTSATCTVTPTATTSYSVAGVNATGTGTAASATVTVTPVGTFALGVGTSGTGYGNVASSPGGIACYVPQPGVAYLVAPDCSENYTSGASVTLSATPDAGSSFTGWSGACSGTGTCTVSMTEARSVTATFALNVTAPVCTLNANPSSITAGSSSTLTATCTPAATSYIWTGGSCAGTSASTCTVSPTATTTYTVQGSNAGGTNQAASVTVTVSTTANATSYTVPGTLGSDVFVPTAGNSYYGGAGNDTYIISPNTLRGEVTAKIIDTEGDNLVQLVDGMTVTASAFYDDAAQLTLSSGAKVQILGASKFKFQLGANALAGDAAVFLSYSDFVTNLGASLTSGLPLPVSGTAGYVVPTGFTQAAAPTPAVAGASYTVPGTLGDDVLVPSGGNNYLGGGGNDTYTISPYTLSGSVTTKIIDTEGSNVIQLVGGLTIESSTFFNNAVQLTLSLGAKVQILGASGFSYQLGANAPAGEAASSLTFAQFASTLGASVPTGTSAVSGSANFVVLGSGH
ncbi:MAG: hypothetical protein IPH35_26010 [Rhodoferax sp.]|nr:hypothetical protein [Rhodoferax sp.]